MYYNSIYGRQPIGQGQTGGMGHMGSMDGMDHMGQLGSMGGMMNLGQDAFLMNDISKAIIGEVHAYNFYERLAALAPDEQYRQIIRSIQRDEARHYHWFTMMIRMMGGQLPQIPQGELPVNFKDGVRTAIRHELETAAFYQDISMRATTHHVQMHFMHAMHDEQRHASWFQYMLTAI